MRKTIIFVLAFLLLALTACVGPPKEPETTTTKAQRTTITTETQPTTVETTTVNITMGNSVIEPRIRRPIYYSLPYSFAELVGRDVFYAWDVARYEKEEFENECIAVSFIKHFKVSKEDFTRANEVIRAQAAELGYEEHSYGEVYDVDLIYTFDNEKINEFFLWENGPYDY